MNPIKIRTLVGDHYSSDLRKRCDAANAAATAIAARQNRLEIMRETITDTFREFGAGSPGTTPGWVCPSAFADADAAMVAAVDMRRESLAIPLDAARLADEVDACREQAGQEWERELARRRAELEAAEVAATKEASRFKGLSDAARLQHVADGTAAARKAASAPDPCPATWHAWQSSAVVKTRQEAVAELQRAFAKLV